MEEHSLGEEELGICAPWPEEGTLCHQCPRYRYWCNFDGSVSVASVRVSSIRGCIGASRLTESFAGKVLSWSKIEEQFNSGEVVTKPSGCS